MTNDLHHLAAAYALDALDESERREFEAHYPSCAICSAEVSDYRETAALLAESATTSPPADLKDRLMAEIGSTRQIAPILPDRVVDLAERKRRNAPRQRVLALAAAAVVAVVGFLGGLQVARSGDDLDDVLVAVDAETLPLEGTAGNARVVWSPSEDRAVLIASDLSDPGTGRAYELWLIDAGGPNATGLFRPDADGTVRIQLDLDGRSPAAWGITNEPDTGSDQPTGEILLIGEIA
ncbi:MAG: anti-sigma factor [Acidimicrobiales bacterium]|nr:anti-sigma factor [Acidimicrobiales bacterium]